ATGVVSATGGAAGNEGAADASADSAPSRASLAASDIGWRDFFTDAHLQEVIALALANNRGLRVAGLHSERARAACRGQRGALLPSLQAVGAFTKESIPGSVTGFGIPLNESYYSANLGVSAFQLDLFGRVRSLTHSALEQYFAQDETRRSAQLTLIAEIANAYLTLASDRELQRLAQQTLASQQQSFDLTRRRYDTGAASGLDLAQAETTVESARADVEHYGGVVQTQIDALTLLVGSPIASELLPGDFAGQVVGLAALPAGVPSAVLL